LSPMADVRGSYLRGGTGWYPQIGQRSFTYRLRVDLPPGQRGVVPGRLVAEQADRQGYQATFEFAHPAEGIALMAGPFEVRERELARGDAAPIRLRTWFHPELSDLSDPYLDAVEGYIQLYGDWVGAYPFTEFSVVSSPLPTGFGMPTLTYLGIDVLRLPFIRATSLGHEVLHSWWGNGVYVDYDQGNWCEGLTTFMADYFYKEQESVDAARTMRLDWLRDFAAIPPGQDYPLRQFTARTHGTSQIVGYHKAAFVFFMLRELIGAAAFDAGLRHFWQEQQFRRANWADLRRTFEGASGRDLSAFFDQWLNRAGAPHLWIEAAQAHLNEHPLRAEVTLRQDPPPYALRVPLHLVADGFERTEVVSMASEHEAVAFTAATPPQSVTLDPDLRVFRQLEPREAPAILRQVMLDPATSLVVAAHDPAVREAAGQLAARLLDAPPHGGAGKRALLVIGTHDEIDQVLMERSLDGRPSALAGKGTAQVWASLQPDGAPVLIISARDADALRALQRPLPHYGRQSWLVFDGGKAVERGIWSGETVSVPFTDSYSDTLSPSLPTKARRKPE